MSLIGVPSLDPSNSMAAKSLLNDRARRLPWPVTRNFGETREAVGDGIPFFGYFLRGQFNLQRGDGPRLLFHFDLHKLTVTALCRRRKTCHEPGEGATNGRSFTFS